MIQEIKDEIIEGSPKYNITDNADGTKNIELANEIIQEGTPLNKSFFENFKSDISDYELLTYTKENVSTSTPVDMFGRLPSNTSSNTVLGNSINGTVYYFNPTYQSYLDTGWNFKIEGSKQLRLAKNSTDYLDLYAAVNGSYKIDVADINYALLRKSTANDTYITTFGMKNTDYLQFTWDFQTPCTPTFNCDIVKCYAEFLGSTNGSDWVTIHSNVTGGNTSSSPFTLDVTTPYRYFRLKITKHSSFSSFDIYYMYFSNVPYTFEKFINKFTSTNDFSKFKCKNVLVPSNVDFTNVTSNTLNGYNIDKMLQPDMRYNIMLEDNKMINGLGTLHGVTGILSYNQSITLDFMPILLFVQYSNNTNKLVQPMQPTKTITNTGNGGSSSTTMSYCAFY